MSMVSILISIQILTTLALSAGVAAALWPAKKAAAPTPIERRP
ncbi:MULTISPECIES: hypothetical protein [Rhodopseudomonas]|nr:MULTISPECIES: hypothetical protein [Rhodopseudomonas]MDF3809291.1 hypothetical protein [Rhodopseudomonas sp. BAL398]WOK19026.1 hypothetical protein RBJ75_05770 [Rhodopseudomonas sp. BAL398]